MKESKMPIVARDFIIHALAKAASIDEPVVRIVIDASCNNDEKPLVTIYYQTFASEEMCQAIVDLVADMKVTTGKDSP